jgi:hypothetical protein
VLMPALLLSVDVRHRVRPNPGVCCDAEPVSGFPTRDRSTNAKQTLENGAAVQAREVNPLMRIAGLSLHR